MILRKLLPCLACLLFSISFLQAKEDYTEAIYSVKYKRFGEEYFIYEKADSLYIPLQDVMDLLRIYYKEEANMNITGYVNDASKSFHIDFSAGNAQNIGGKSFDLNSKSWLYKDMIFYVHTDLFNELFNVNNEVFPDDLRIYIRSEYDLPIDRAVDVYKRAKNFKEQQADTLAPVMYTRNYKIINGGTVDYSIGASHSKMIGTAYNGYANLGMELFGGEFQYNNSFSHRNEFEYRNNYRLRYTFENDFVSNIALGKVSNYSMRSSSVRGYRKQNYTFLGAQISNQEMLMPKSFSTKIIENKIAPNWRVELYLNNNLYKIQTTDVNGNYRFEIPVSYGNTNIKVKLYGPKGEYIVEEELFNVPAEFLRSGEIRYSAAGGKEERENFWLANTNLSMGLTDWLTSSFDITKAESQSNFDLVGQSAINLHNKIKLNLLATNSGIYQSALQFNLDFLGRHDIVAISYDRNFDKNRSSPKLNFLLNSYINNIFTLPLHLRLTADRKEFDEFASNTANFDFSTYLGPISVTYRHNVRHNDRDNELSQDANVNLNYHINNRTGLFSFLGSLRMSATSGIDIENKRLRDINAGLDQSISRTINIRYQYGRDLINHTDQFSISMNMNMPTFRNSTSANFNERREGSYQTSFNGAMEFDSQSLSINMINSFGGSAYGKSSAMVRFYIDGNDNNIFDEGENIVEGADCSLTNMNASKLKKGDYILFTSMIPNKRYNLKVNKESFENPVIQPKYQEFSFITDPYSYKKLDIPCVVVGGVEGQVDKIDINVVSPQSGVKIVIKGIDEHYYQTCKVFSDGSFFFIGVPPGNYTAEIDSTQLSIIGRISKPSKQLFTIKTTEDGDFKEGINFILYSKDEFENENISIETELSSDDTEIQTEAIFFYSDSLQIEISIEMEQYLTKLIEHLSNNDANVVITGYSSNTEDKYSARKISGLRAKDAYNYLISNMLEANRIVYKNMYTKELTDSKPINILQKDQLKIEIKYKK